jgi:hypothetical protein
LPGFEGHLNKYKHNKAFVVKGISSKGEDFGDWSVTGYFYAAVHIIEALLAQKMDMHSRNHGERKQYMRENLKIFNEDCYTSYIELQSLSEKSRYKVDLIKNEEVIKAMECLEDIELECRSYI